MMISEKVNAALNEQVTNELGASQTYLAMSCFLKDLGLNVLAAFFRKQTEEERMHGLKILDYILDVGAKARIGALAEPPMHYPSVAATVEAALNHELKVTRQIHDLVSLAEQERDWSTRSFLQWYVDEQVEEVSTMTQLLQLARLAGDDLLKLELHLDKFGMGESKEAESEKGDEE
ncbi:MAG: ferritin [Phycisphaerales bacterium]|nr:ferritin [Phycisphaerales bacterium]